MTDYTKSTNFASKDSLASGNPLKIVKGTEFDTEFNNIATSSATKADLASPALTGTPTAPTATAGTNTTQIATTAFVETATSNERSATATLTNKTVNLTSNTLTGTKAQFNTACSDADFASLAGTETLTNKTVDLASNTVTGTKAQFNTACSDTDFSFLNDFTGSNQSLGTSGYQKLPGGLIVQWGSFTDAANSTTTVTFPLTFPTKVVAAFHQGPASGSAYGVDSVTTSSMVCAAGTFYGASNPTAPHYWVALGY